MEKRGQLTIFIIIGMVILFVLAIVFFLVYKPLKEPETPPEQFADVKNYVDACVKQTLRDGVNKLGRGPHTDYNKALEDYMKTYVVYCPNFTADFPDMSITPKDVISVKVTLNNDQSLVSAVVVYPITITRGAFTKTLDNFYGDYTLVEKACAAVPINNRIDCRYSGSSSTTVKVSGITFTYNPGDFVGVGGTCIAC